MPTIFRNLDTRREHLTMDQWDVIQSRVADLRGQGYDADYVRATVYDRFAATWPNANKTEIRSAIADAFKELAKSNR